MAIEQVEELTVAVMGATGTGKSTFVNLASGSNLPVGSSLRSCTAEVQVSQVFDVQLPQSSTLRQCRMRLLDTPGFDDTTKSDKEILKMIASFLANAYREDKKLSGIIYMHRITDTRFSGVSRRNLEMFKKLCGEKTLRNVVLVTNMWGQVDHAKGEAREHELATDTILFKPLLDAGAQMMRHDDTLESAHRILSRFVDNQPEPLAIQREVVDEGKLVEGTSAGVELVDEEAKKFEEVKRQHEEEHRKAREAAEAVAREQEACHAAELERMRKETEEQMRRAREAHEREEEERRRQENQRHDGGCAIF